MVDQKAGRDPTLLSFALSDQVLLPPWASELLPHVQEPSLQALPFVPSPPPAPAGGSESSAPLYTGARVWGEVERNSSVALPGEWGHSGPVPSEPSVPAWGGWVEFQSKCGCDRLMDVSSDGLAVRSVGVSTVSFQAWLLVWGLCAVGVTP